MTGGYKKPFKIHTNAPKRLKYGLKWSPADTHHDLGAHENWGPLHPNFEKKMSGDILDHKEYPLGIILSHIWAFFGALVWILEDFLYPPATFRIGIFDR